MVAAAYGAEFECKSTSDITFSPQIGIQEQKVVTIRPSSQRRGKRGAIWCFACDCSDARGAYGDDSIAEPLGVPTPAAEAKFMARVYLPAKGAVVLGSSVRLRKLVVET